MRKQREDVTMQPLNCRIELEVEPYRTLIGDDTSVTVLQGNGGWGGGETMIIKTKTEIKAKKDRNRN